MRWLPPETTAAIGRCEIFARTRKLGFISGRHRSPKKGNSVEFAEHREYLPGDDLRALDWKVLGRKDRLYVRQYEEETNLRATVLLDASGSMAYVGDAAAETDGRKLSKFDYARYLAAGLAHLLTGQQDATALVTFDFSDGRTLRLSNRFPMPFFRSARVRLENRGKTPVKLDGATVRTNVRLRYPAKNTGLFTATEYLPRTGNKLNVNAHIGRFVGRGLMAYGVVTGYFLHGNACEGDVRCFIDDMTTPRVQSDGSESWGAWGWGFHFPPQVSPFSCYHAVNDYQNKRYRWSLLRLTFADAYNFRRFLRFDIEHGEFNDQPDSAHSGQCFGYLIYDHD